MSESDDIQINDLCERLMAANERIEEIARLTYPRTCWMDHEDIGHRRELGDCPLCKSMQANDQANRRIAELEAGLKTAWDAMCERRSYADGWEWKYKPAWDEEDKIVSELLEGK